MLLNKKGWVLEITKRAIGQLKNVGKCHMVQRKELATLTALTPHCGREAKASFTRKLGVLPEKELTA